MSKSLEAFRYLIEEGGIFTPPIRQDLEDLIKRDLEVLEIIKHIVKIADYSDRTIQGGNLVILVGGEIKTFEEYQKIKEWLENEWTNKWRITKSI